SNEDTLNNAHADWANWANNLCEQGQYQNALKVLAVGRELAPKDSMLENNRSVVWQEWIKATYAKEGETGAKVLIRRLQKENPDEDDLRLIVRSHVIHCFRQLVEEAKDYQGALAVINRYKDVLNDNNEAKDLSISVYDAWASPHIDVKNWPVAIKIYK